MESPLCVIMLGRRWYINALLKLLKGELWHQSPWLKVIKGGNL